MCKNIYVFIKFGKAQFKMTSNDINSKIKQSTLKKILAGEMLTTCTECQVPNSMKFLDEDYHHVNLNHTIDLNYRKH